MGVVVDSHKVGRAHTAPGEAAEGHSGTMKEVEVAADSPKRVAAAVEYYSRSQKGGAVPKDTCHADRMVVGEVVVVA